MAAWLITRPAREAAALAAQLAEQGHDSVAAPMLDIQFYPESSGPLDLSRFQAVLVTSANAVRALEAANADRAISILAVGGATAAAARSAGFGRVGTAGGDAQALARLVIDTVDPMAGPLLHASGRDTAGPLAATLADAGFAVQRIVLYTARAASQLPDAAHDALSKDRVAGVLFFSPRTAEVFGKLVRHAGLINQLSGLYALCLSPAVAMRLRQEDWRGIRVAKRPDQASLVALIDGFDDRGLCRRNALGSSTRTQQQESGQDGMDPRPDSPDEQDQETASGAATPADQDTDTDQDQSGETPAERIIALFGGIRPMAGKLHVPVTTVQGWKKRGAIPEARHSDIMAAAASHGIALTAAELAAAAPEASDSDNGAAAGTGAPAADAPSLGASEGTTEPATPSSGSVPDSGRIWAAGSPVADPGEVSEAERRALTMPAPEPASDDDDRDDQDDGKPGRPQDRTEERAGAAAAAGIALAAANGGGAGGAAPSRRAAGESADDDRHHDDDDDGLDDVVHDSGGGGSGIAWLALVLAVVGAGGAFTAPLWGPSVAPSIWPADTGSETADTVAALQAQIATLDATVAALAEERDVLQQNVAELQANASADAQTDAITAELAPVESSIADLANDIAGVQTGLSGLLDRVEAVETAPAAEVQIADLPDLGGFEDRLTELESALADLPTPAQPAPAEVTLPAELDQRLTALEGQVADTAAGQGGAVDPLAVAGLDERLTAVEASVEGVLAEPAAADMTLDATALAALSGQLDAINGRVGGLETRVEEVVETGIAGLRQGLSDFEPVQVELGVVSDRVATLEAAPLADPAMAGTVAGLGSQIEEVADAVATVRSDIDAVAQAAAARRAADLRGQALSLATAQMRQQVNAGAAFAVPLQAVLSLLDGDADAALGLAPLEPYAVSGIPTRDQLSARFPQEAAEARAAAALPADADWIDETVIAVTSLVSVTPIPGEEGETGSVDGRLARAAHRVVNGDLDQAVSVLQGMEGPAAAAIADWLADAEARLAAEAALRSLDERAITRLMEVEAEAAAGAPTDAAPQTEPTTGATADSAAGEAGQ